jgi:alkylation response protein AidB-like acyl-CoA dehydrogenase
VNYHRPDAIKAQIKTAAAKAGDGWIINGSKDCVANAPIAELFAVTVLVSGSARVLLLPANAPDLTVRANENAWHHGPCGEVEFKDCRVPEDNLLSEQAGALLQANGNALSAALALGIGRAAYEAALDYTQLRVQGGRRIVEHQAIGMKLAESAMRLDAARAAVWRAAWAADHPGATADRSLPDLPLALLVQTFTAEAMLAVCKDAAECFGAMGVMRDMPLQKYLRDARVCLHSADARDAKLRVAEALAGYRRPVHAMAAE